MMDEKWVEKCCMAAEFLYGYCPVEVLRQMIGQKKGAEISRSDLIDFVSHSDAVLLHYEDGVLEGCEAYGEGYFAPYALEGTKQEPMMRKIAESGNPYALLHVDAGERDSLLKQQMDKPFYIPLCMEVEELLEKGYIRTPAMTELEDRVREMGSDPDFLGDMWPKISTEALDMHESIQYFFDRVHPGEEFMTHGEGGDEPDYDMNKLNALISLLMNFMNQVHTRANRGWTPDELGRIMHPRGFEKMPTLVPGSAHAAQMMKHSEKELAAMGMKVDYSSIDRYTAVGEDGEKRVLRVGRNDLCPCGSGKKYKRCHGRQGS